MEGSKGKKIKIVDIIRKKDAALPDAVIDSGVKQDFKKQEIADIPKEKTEILEVMVAKERKMEEKEIKTNQKNKKFEERLISGKKRKIWLYVFLAVVLFGGISFAYAAVKILPKANIEIITKKANWSYENSIRVDSKIGGIDIANRLIPAAVFYQQKKNLTVSWPATGKKQVSLKASGKIIIFNAYSSGSQALVAGTRFKSPDGKIFRLVSKTTVPGAKVESGKIVPSSIEAEIAAEKAGESYNIGMVSHFSIPGFEDTDKYEKFYAESKTPISGGFVGEVPYPNDDDVKKAKEAAQKQIKEAIEGFFYAQIIAENFKIIEETKQFDILKEIVNKDADASGNFTVYIEADASAQAFQESSLLDLMSSLAEQTIGEGFEIKNYTLDYKGTNVDLKNKTAVLSVNFSGVFWKPVETEDFTSQIIGKSDSELKAIIFSSEIERADIYFWPFWVDSVPKNSKKISVTIK